MKKLLALITIFLFTMATGATAKTTLRILTKKGYTPEILVKKFENETGIKVEITFSTNETMIAKLRATRGAGFDLAQPSQDRIAIAQKKFKIFQPLNYSKIKTSQLIDSMVKMVKKNTTVAKKIYGVPFCYGTSGLIVNKKLAAEATDYSALLNETYKGRISYSLKRSTLIALAFAAGDDPYEKYHDAETYQALMDSIAENMIKAKPLVKKYWVKDEALLAMMRSGEVSVAMARDKDGWKLHAENIDIDFVAPESGALGWVDTFAIPAKAKNIGAAYKWINFILKPENAAVFTNKEKYGSASKGAGKFLDDDTQNNFSRSFSASDIANIKWFPPAPTNLVEIEGKILDKIKTAK